MSFYSDLGLKPVINAATTFTALGGSLMPDEVLEAMRDAAGSFVDMHELHVAAGKSLAELTRNDAAYVTSGCAAALILALLGIRTKGDPRVLTEFPGRERAPSEVIMHASHRIPYDAAIAMSGVTIRLFVLAPRGDSTTTCTTPGVGDAGMSSRERTAQACHADATATLSATLDLRWPTPAVGAIGGYR